MLSEKDFLPLEDDWWSRNCTMDVRGLSNTELKEQLLKHGVNPGPILPTTRSVYEKRLKHLLEEALHPVEENRAGSNDQYSDSDNEDSATKNLEEMRNEPVFDGLQNTNQPKVPASLAAEYKQNLATLGDDFTVTRILKQMERRSSVEQAVGYTKELDGRNVIPKFQEKVTADKNTMTYRSPANTPKACVFVTQSRPKLEDDLPDDFSKSLSLSPLGMSATRRKPIKGAAGRPIQFRYEESTTKSQVQENTKPPVTKKSATRLVPVFLQIVIFIVFFFISLIYFTLEQSPENPFRSISDGDANGQQQ
ncbi:hypothetical protein GDO86_003423 [Hymenochirus boettgeri]|uniref:LEM domain-containing protein n=1 Tax=Hymenochirus boettgeri TaxID=247094 RepID=A0A8T2K3D4_9PIPI|nr:hypothetical protein GDO86_003423 [Hymenochirus boettgeri]